MDVKNIAISKNIQVYSSSYKMFYLVFPRTVNFITKSQNTQLPETYNKSKTCLL